MCRIGKNAMGLATPVRQYIRGGIPYRRLGQSDLYVSLLSFGSHTDPAFKRPAKHGSVLTPEGQARRDRMIAHALDLGVNMIDTYEDAGQWEPVARLLGTRRKKVLVSLCRQFPQFVGNDIDEAAKLFGYVDLYRIYIGDGPKLSEQNLLDWDVMRKAKESGRVRAIGISCHNEQMLLSALEELEGLDYVMLPFNFIQSRLSYSTFLPAATAKGIGIIAIKPLAAGSIASLDPRQRAESKPENARVEVYQRKFRPLLPAVVAGLTRSLHQLPDETLCQAALRFVYSQPFVTTATAGMFEAYQLDENYKALRRSSGLTREESAALAGAKQLAEIQGPNWLPPHYRWLHERWHA